jgi:hypothetical protein
MNVEFRFKENLEFRTKSHALEDLTTGFHSGYAWTENHHLNNQQESQPCSAFTGSQR